MPLLDDEPTLTDHPRTAIRGRGHWVFVTDCEGGVPPLAGVVSVPIDNINQRLDSGPLAAALTATRIRQRILQVSRTGVVLVRCLWVGTGNNVVMSRELIRRTVPTRLLPDRENPWEGKTYKRKLPLWALERRPQLVTACLTLGRAWVRFGNSLIKLRDRIYGNNPGRRITYARDDHSGRALYKLVASGETGPQKTNDPGYTVSGNGDTVEFVV